MRGAVQEGARLRAHRRASRLVPGADHSVRRASRRTHRGLCLGSQLLADVTWRGRDRRGHAGTPDRRGVADRRSDPVARPAPLEPLPLGPRPEAARGQADEPDGARRVSGTPRCLVPLSDLLAPSGVRRREFLASTLRCTAWAGTRSRRYHIQWPLLFLVLGVLVAAPLVVWLVWD